MTDTKFYLTEDERNRFQPLFLNSQAIKEFTNSYDELKYDIDNHAYFRRDIEPFKTIGGLDQVKGMKEYILDKRIEGADKDEYFLRHNGGGQFEIRKRVDLSVVYGDDNEPLIFYQKDLYKLYKDREAEGKKIIKEEALTLQEKKQEAKQEAESFKGISP